MKTVLYMHGGSGNHGCEALVRTTTKLAKDNLNTDVVLWSKAASEDVKYGVDKIVDQIVVTDNVPRNSLGFFTAYFKYKILKKSSALHDRFIKNTFKNSAAISIGGDNYCYPWSAKEGVQLDSELRRYCKKNIFWGCSIEEEFMTPEVVEDLKGFDLITVRESLSYEVLKSHGINAVKVADSAFLLPEKELPLPDGFIEGNTVGINISPLINDYEGGESIAYKNYVHLIEHIIEKTDMNICLIPHVIWEQVDDRKPMRQLFEQFKESKRVILLEDYNCEELKGFISRCRFFIGARTHATIAAYSTCVPTLVVGYSIKSKGIALDLFGTYDNYVVSVQEMKKDSELTEAFEFIVKNELTIKERLTKFIPDYKEKALSAGQALKDLFS
ncbi:MAG: polysaccharide pyruvyl transferase family protein [Ruminococcus sp.]|nr:polysaccharide pyruvyl transferase family protein [Ruminococcus sp.]